MSDNIMREAPPKPQGKCVLVAWVHRDAYMAFQKISNAIKQTPCENIEAHRDGDLLCASHTAMIQALASITVLLADGNSDKVNELMKRAAADLGPKSSFVDRLRRTAYRLSEGE